MPKAVSTTSINKVLAASASKKVGMSKSYVTRGYTKLLKDKLPDNRYGSIRIDRLMSKQKLKLDKVEEIIEVGRKKGVFGEKDSAKKLFKEAQREEMRMAQEEKKIIQTEKITAQAEQKNSTANKPVAAQNQGVKKSLPSDDKKANIDLARRKTEAAERLRGAALRGKIGQVIEEQNKFRKTWGKSAELTVTSRGGGRMATEERSGGLVGHAVVEEEKGGSTSKSEQKTGGNTPANQKSGGHQGLELKGTAGIDQLAHPQEISNKEFTGGVYHVKGLDKAPANPPEAPPVQKPSSASEDPDEMNI